MMERQGEGRCTGQRLYRGEAEDTEKQRTVKHAKGKKKRRHTEVKCDTLLDEQENRLTYNTRGTYYRLCPEISAKEVWVKRVVVAQDVQDE
jgi:hypothetical protein